MGEDLEDIFALATSVATGTALSLGPWVLVDGTDYPTFSYNFTTARNG